MGLSNYQLVLLDNLIYLNTIVYGASNDDSSATKMDVRTIIKILLYKDSDPANGAGTGIVNEDCIN